MITINVTSNKFGESKQYIAHITGCASKFTFAREFVGRKTGRRNEYTEYATDEPGLFEDCDIDKKGNKEIGYLIIATNPAGELVKMRSDLADAMVIAKRLDAGEALEDMLDIVPKEGHSTWTYSLRTKAEAKAAITGATIESATEACWQLLQALPEREAKKVLAALKLRISTKPVSSPVAEIPTVESDAQ